MAVSAGQRDLIRGRRRNRAFDLRLLGGFDLRDADGLVVELPTRKYELLLAYLAMPAGRPHTRDRLAGLFWGDRDEEQARGSLRKALSALRAALGPEALQVDRDTVSLAENAIGVDAERLAELADDSRLDELAADPKRAAEAGTKLTYGEFLDSKLPSSTEFADWLSFERARCRNLAQTVFDRLAQALADAGKTGAALAVANRLLALDGLREESHRLLMRLYTASGERSRALAQFQACRDLLRRELNVEPSPETVRLSREIAGDAGAPPPPMPIAAAAPRLPTERPHGLSIAVMSFASGGGDPAEDFFAEGLAEDIITELSRQRDLLVIARTSSFTYGNSPRIAATAATELDVRYVLTGSLRRAGGRLRITVQLIDAAGDRCVWAERYDREAEDVFDVQDAVVASIIANIDARVRSAERERAARKRPENLDAWELFHRGMWHMYRFTRADTVEARNCFDRCREIAPDFSAVYGGLAYASLVSVTWHFTDAVPETIGQGIAFASKAITLDDGDAFSHVVLGRLLTFTGDLERAIRHLDTAIALNPSFAQGYFGLAQAQFWAGKPAEALQSIDQALRLNPRDPLSSMFMTLKSFSAYWLGDFEEAERSARRGAALAAGETWSRMALAAALMARLRPSEAEAAIAEALAIDPNLTVASFDAIVGHVPTEMRKRVYADLRRAGLS